MAAMTLALQIESDAMLVVPMPQPVNAYIRAPGGPGLGSAIDEVIMPCLAGHER